jgi:hypothetical protein
MSYRKGDTMSTKSEFQTNKEATQKGQAKPSGLDTIEEQATLSGALQQVRLDPRALSPKSVLQLQRTVGNRATRYTLHTNTVTPVNKKVIQRAHFVTTGTDLWDDNNPDQGFLDDDFDTVIKPQIGLPSSEAAVANAVNSGSNIDLTLWRGTTPVKAALIQANQSAGGVAPDPTVAAPNIAAAQQQIQQGGVLPEYTTNSEASWSAGSWLIVVTINSRYLTRGSVSEQGWVCDPSAPVVVNHTVDRTCITTGGTGANAS